MIKFENKIFVIKSNKLLEIPEICDRKKLLEEAHLETGYGCLYKTYQKLKEKYYGKVNKKVLKIYVENFHHVENSM